MSFLVAVSIWSSTAAAAGNLPRHGSLGVFPQSKNGAITVARVVPSSAADLAGLRPGDVIKTVDGASVSTVQEFVAKLHRPANTPVRLGIDRNGTMLNKTVALHEAPKERSADFDIRYDSVVVDGSLRRTLVTVPRNPGKHPAVLFIGGIGCYSIDNVPRPDDGYRQLAYDLTKHGFITMRLEKSGIGDSQGPPCETVDFNAESHSYETALEVLSHMVGADSKHIYLFGHSIGTVIAPRIAPKQSIAGVIAAEGVSINWFEYELINNRRQLPLSGVKPADVEMAMRLKEYCMHRLLVENQSVKQILHDRQDCSGDVDYPVPISYMRELAGLNMADSWLKLSVPVLAIYGTSDFETDVEDHRHIVALVNSKHRGNGTLRIIPKMDHFLLSAASQQASFDRESKNKIGTYDEAFSRAILDWLSAVGKSSLG